MSIFRYWSLTWLIASLLLAAPHALAQSSGRAPAAGTQAADTGSSTRPDPRRFPSIDLGQLPAAQQRTFMEIVESELCPCPGSTLSLAQCLEDVRGTCGLAREATQRISQGLMRNESVHAISRGIAETVQRAQTVREFPLDGVPSKGARRPTVTMVSFADYECPYCRELARITDELLKAYPNDLRVYFMNFPLSGHAHAMDAAIAATAAQKQNKFWEFHDILFANQAQISRSMDAVPLFTQWARSLGLDIERFEKDMADHANYQRVQNERQAALDAGARGTPTIYLNGVQLLDIDTTAAIRARIDALIQEAKK